MLILVIDMTLFEMKPSEQKATYNNSNHENLVISRCLHHGIILFSNKFQEFHNKCWIIPISERFAFVFFVFLVSFVNNLET